MKTKITSFAVLDIETTSLPSLNFNKTNITEISIHGFNTEDVAKSINYNSLRINHKLTLLFNPLMFIEQKSEQITGLNNYILEHESTLDINAANVIVNFLKHLRQPVCLVAHNGNEFDFRVLKHAFSKLGLEVPNDILYVDSLVAFKDIDFVKKSEKEDEFFVPLPDLEFKVESIDTPSKNDKNIEQIEEQITTNSSETHIESTKSHLQVESSKDWQKVNETTPRRLPNVVNIERKRKKEVGEDSSLTPTEPKSRKSLKFSPTSTKALSYTLGAIYERLFGNPPEIAHHAEADVITLKKIMLKYGKSFVDYAEVNAKQFSEVKKLGAR